MGSQIPVRRHPIGHLETFDVTRDELDGLRKAGGNLGVDFNLGLFCATLAASFLITLFTTEINSRVTHDTFIFVVIAGFFASVVFGIKWWRNRGDFEAIVTRIKERPLDIGPVGDEQETLDPTTLEVLPAEKEGGPRQ